MDTGKPRVFLSSALRDGAGDLPLRRRLLDQRKELPVDLWAYEMFWPLEGESSAPAADTIIDRCFEGIRKCDLFVFLLSGRHGTSAGYLPDGVHASYLELELFAAAMLRKSVLVLHQQGRNAEPPLGDALALLSREFPADRYFVGNDQELYQRFLAECRFLTLDRPMGSEPVLHRLADWLSRRRSHASFAAELANPNLRFLDNRLVVHRKANPDKATLLLDQVASGTRDTPAGSQPLPHGAALFRVWAAMRELMDDRQSAIADPAMASLWDRALGLWASHASWFGLHGHVWMGPLASCQSQIALRRRFTHEKAFNSTTDVREPVGARASALYSVAQRMTTRRQKIRQFQLAESLAAKAIELNPDNNQGALAIRGHTALQLARLGYVWKLWEAEADFRRGLALRERFAASGAQVGEAMIDLGLCLVLTGRTRTGMSLLEEGVTRMRADESAIGKAFLARALRNLELGARVSLRTGRARAVRAERLAMASDIQAMDQTR